MLTRGGLFIRNPRLRFATDDDTDKGGAGSEDKVDEPKFPADTPVKDMSAEQQAAYWKDKARKHEGRVSQYGDLTPEKVTQLQTELATLRAKGLTAEEAAIEQAKEAGRTEVRGLLAAERVKNALTTALAGRVPDANALLDLDRSQFISGDGANVGAIKAWVEEHSTAAAVQKQAPDLGAGRHRGNTGEAAKGVGAGRDLYADRHPSKKTS